MTDSSTPRRGFARALLRGSFWVYAARYSGQGLAFLSTVVLARLLTPEDFGLAGYALLVIGLLEVVRHLGIGTAIIYLDDDPERRDTAFWMSLAVAIVLAGGTWVAAPAFAALFQEPRVTDLTRLLALHFPLAAFGTVQSALIDKELRFRRRLLPEIGKGAAKGGVAVVMALLGFGVWSILVGHLAGTATLSLLLWGVSDYRPALRFSARLARPTLRYGVGYAGTEALGYALQNLDYLLIGRFLGAGALGIYTLAFRIPELVIKQSAGIIGSVSFPAFSQVRRDPGRLRAGYLRTVRLQASVLAPAALGLAIVADPMVAFVFGSRWLDVVPVLQVIAAYTWLRTLVFTAGSVYKAIGRPGLLNAISLAQLVVTVPSLWWAAGSVGTIVAVAWMQVALATLFGVVKWVVVGIMLRIGFATQVRQILPGVTAAMVMGGAVLLAGSIDGSWHPGAALAWRVAIGAISYVAAFWSMWRGDFVYGVRLVRDALPGARSPGVERS